MYVLSAELSTRSIHFSKPKTFVISRSNTRVLFRLALVKTQRFTKDCSQKFRNWMRLFENSLVINRQRNLQ